MKRARRPSDLATRSMNSLPSQDARNIPQGNRRIDITREWSIKRRERRDEEEIIKGKIRGRGSEEEQ
jgi:hypothetical protein